MKITDMITITELSKAVRRCINIFPILKKEISRHSPTRLKSFLWKSKRAIFPKKAFTNTASIGLQVKPPPLLNIKRA